LSGLTQLYQFSAIYFSKEIIVSVEKEDKILFCRDCGEEFIFSAREQDFYAQKGFENDPVRCSSCRSARKNATSNAGGAGNYSPAGNGNGGGNYSPNYNNPRPNYTGGGSAGNNYASPRGNSGNGGGQRSSYGNSTPPSPDL
jgi:hypothetical protein